MECYRKWYRIGPHLEKCDACESIMTLSESNNSKNYIGDTIICFTCGHKAWSTTDVRALHLK